MSKWDFWKQLHWWLGRKAATRDDKRDDKSADNATETRVDTIPPEQPQSDVEGSSSKQSFNPFLKPTLYFSGWGYDERNGKQHVRDQGKETQLLEAGGQMFTLRKWYRAILFRENGDMDERAALVLLQDLEPHRQFQLANISPQAFADAVTQWRFGRCLLYIADNMTRDQSVYLLFAPDGRGEAREGWLFLPNFVWRDATTLDWATLLTADPEELRPLCKLLFDTKINPYCANPYIDPASLVSVPHRFLRGSEEMLRLLTIAIVQTEPGLLDASLEPVTITYRAQTPTKRAGMTHVKQGDTRLLRGRLTSLCDLALRLNTFVGVEWKPLIPSANRLSHWEKQIHKIHVTIQSPSAHERAESLLVLAEWLEGKVREPKRLRVLGLEED